MKAANWIIAVATVVNVIIFGYSLKLFPKPDIKVEGDTQLTVDHEWGNLHLVQYFAITNNGDKQGSINKVESLIRRKDNKQVVIKFSKAFFERNGRYPPLVDLALNPSEILNGNIDLTSEDSYDNKKKISKYKNYIYT